MEQWQTELAKMGPLALAFGLAVVALWRRILQKDDTIAAQNTKSIEDQKETARALLESTRLTDKLLTKLYQREGRSYSPPPSSSS